MLVRLVLLAALVAACPPAAAVSREPAGGAFDPDRFEREVVVSS